MKSDSLFCFFDKDHHEKFHSHRFLHFGNCRTFQQHLSSKENQANLPWICMKCEEDKQIHNEFECDSELSNQTNCFFDWIEDFWVQNVIRIEENEMWHHWSNKRMWNSHGKKERNKFLIWFSILSKFDKVFQSFDFFIFFLLADLTFTSFLELVCFEFFFFARIGIGCIDFEWEKNLALWMHKFRNEKEKERKEKISLFDAKEFECTNFEN